MNADDLAAIRARDAENRLLRLGPDADPDLGEWMGYAVRDRRALLAEVDRLTEACQEMLSAMLSASRNETTQWALGQERARIRTAVEGLARDDCPCGCDTLVSRAAVLAAIDGDEA